MNRILTELGTLYLNWTTWFFPELDFSNPSNAMDCRDFEAFIHDLMDRRQPLELDDDSRQHHADCEECRHHWLFFQQMEGLFDTEFAGIRDAAWRSMEDMCLFNVVQRCVTGASPELETSGSNVPLAMVSATAVPVAMVAPMHSRAVDLVVRTPGRRAMGRRTSIVAGIVLSCCLAATFAMVPFWSQSTTMTGSEDPLTVDSSARQNDVSKTDPSSGVSPRTELAVSELHELTKNWDESVVAFDRGWQNMATGRVRAHQLPGIQPAVYPITGAVEAFRKNMIVRNSNGLAAGVRW